MAWSRDPRKPTRFQRGSKRYNDVGGHSPPGDELENTRDHERIWFELRRHRSCCCDENNPGFRYCLGERSDYPTMICSEYLLSGATLLDYFAGGGNNDNVINSWYLEESCDGLELMYSEPFGSATFYTDGSWRNGPFVTGMTKPGLTQNISPWWLGSDWVNTAHSFEFWIKPSSTDISTQKGLSSAGPFMGLASGGYFTYLMSDGAVGFAHEDVAGGATQVSDAGVFTADEWHHVVFVRRITNGGSFSIYVNGVRVLYTPMLYPCSGVDEANAQFSWGQASNSQWADIARYSGAISGSAIWRHYRSMAEDYGLPLPDGEDPNDGGGSGGGGSGVPDPGDFIFDLSPDKIDGQGFAGYYLSTDGDTGFWESPEDTPFELEANKGVANGYASLDADALVPDDELGSGTASGTVFLRGDRTWAAVPEPTPELPLDAVVGDLARFAGDPFHKTLVLGLAPLAYWPLQEAAGAASALDEIGTNDLTVAGDLSFGNAGGPVTEDTLFADFGATGKLSRGVFSTLTSDFSYSFWFRADSLPAGDRVIFKTGAAGTNGLEMQLRASGKLYGLYQGVAFWNESALSLVADTWYHIALVKDGSDLLLYINGTLDSTISTASMNLPTGNFEIGNAANDWQIAHFAYFDAVLTADNVDDLYNSYNATGGYWEAVDPATVLSGTIGIEASKDGVDVTAAVRGRVNFIEGSNVTLTVTDDAVNGEVDVEIAASASGGSGIEVSDNDVDVTAAARGRINFKDGVGTTAVVTDDGANDEVEVKFDLPSTSGKSDGDVLTLDASLDPVWETPAGGGGGGWTNLINETGGSLANWTQQAGSWSTSAGEYLLDGAAAVWNRLLHSTLINGGLVMEMDFYIDSTGTSRADQRLGFVIGDTGASIGYLAGLKWASNNPAANATAYAENWGIAGYTGPAATFAMDTWHTLKVEMFGNSLAIYLNGTLVWTCTVTTTSGATLSRFVLASYQAKIKLRNVTVDRLTHP